ncbi:MAG TPA: SLC13 family permease [Vicinamibacterales bacterium]|nr:SLC13 family permease [Vicinamibacterales bacterium]
MNLAVISVVALAIAVLVSCFTSLNVGVLAIAMAWIVGVYIGGIPLNTVIAGFPTSLFLTLVGVTLLFSLAQTNGTLDKLAHHAVRLCRGNRGVVPVMFFVMATAIASMGPGNIATAALLAPMAMGTASRAGIPLFLMAIMVGNGANAGSLSPFAPTGIIVNGLMARMNMAGFEVQTYLSNLLAHALVAFGGYFLFGGLKLFRSIDRARAVDPAAVLETTRADQPFEARQWATLGVIGALLVGAIFFEVNVGFGAFLCSVILVLTGCADDGEAIKRMPWRVIIMVTGVTVLIAIMEKAQGIDLMVSLVARISTAGTVTGVVALIVGVISVYSSTSGVVLPAFLPMVPGLAHQLGVTDALGIANAMNVGGHLVDVSPLSTIGALCLAGASSEESRPLFNKLLAWGLSMAIVGAIICYVAF